MNPPDPTRQSRRALTDREKRTIRLGLAIVLSYLVLFYGVRGWTHLERRRAEYQALVQRAHQLKQEFRPYEKKALLIQELKEAFQIEPFKLSKNTIVAEASAAIQKAAAAGGVQLGPLRESPARGSNKELGSIQLEGTGPVAAMLALLHRVQTLGYPLILDSIQVTPDSGKPGTVKVTLTIVILDFEQWKKAEARHA